MTIGSNDAPHHAAGVPPGAMPSQVEIERRVAHAQRVQAYQYDVDQSSAPTMSGETRGRAKCRADKQASPAVTGGAPAPSAAGALPSADAVLPPADEVAALQQEIEGRLAPARARLDDIRNQIATLTTRRQELEAELRKADEELGRHHVAAARALLEGDGAKRETLARQRSRIESGSNDLRSAISLAEQSVRRLRDEEIRAEENVQRLEALAASLAVVVIGPALIERLTEIAALIAPLEAQRRAHVQQFLADAVEGRPTRRFFTERFASVRSRVYPAEPRRKTLQLDDTLIETNRRITFDPGDGNTRELPASWQGFVPARVANRIERYGAGRTLPQPPLLEVVVTANNMLVPDGHGGFGVAARGQTLVIARELALRWCAEATARLTGRIAETGASPAEPRRGNDPLNGGGPRLDLGYVDDKDDESLGAAGRVAV